MKLLRVIIVLSSIFIFGHCAKAGESFKLTETEGTMESMPNPTFLGEEEMYGLTMWVWRSTQFMRFRLNKDEKQLHKSAVFFMLQNAPNGKVRVIQSYPVSGGYCRVYQAYIKLNGSERHTTNIGCKMDGAVTWKFYN